MYNVSLSSILITIPAAWRCLDDLLSYNTEYLVYLVECGADCVFEYNAGRKYT